MTSFKVPQFHITANSFQEAATFCAR